MGHCDLGKLDWFEVVALSAGVHPTVRTLYIGGMSLVLYSYLGDRNQLY